MVEPFISFGQNAEDVVLNRVFRDVEVGTYIEVGANHPRIDSISKSFYDRGWSGVAIEPNPAFAELFRQERSRDVVIEAAITDDSASSATFHIVNGTGLSTLRDDIRDSHAAGGFTVSELTVPTARLDSVIEQVGLAESDIHFLMIDVEGAELNVLRSVDLSRYRPWILVIEAITPGTSLPNHDPWESLVLGAGYEFCLFDGISRFYVAGERSHLKAILAAPASAVDNFISDRELRLRQEVSEAKVQMERGRTEIRDIKRSTSWRITRPLRALGSFLHR